MSNTKKPIENKEPAPEKKLDKRFIVMVSLCVVIIAATVITLLVVRGDFKNIKHWATTTESTEPPVTVDSEKSAADALWNEHLALLEDYKNFYWVGVFDGYKESMPPQVWEKLAKDRGVTVDELYVITEEEFAKGTYEKNKNARIYILETTLLEGEELEECVTFFAEEYEFDKSDIQEMYHLKVEITDVVDGERKTKEDSFFSIKMDGVRYLADESGFILG